MHYTNNGKATTQYCNQLTSSEIYAPVKCFTCGDRGHFAVFCPYVSNPKKSQLKQTLNQMYDDDMNNKSNNNNQSRSRGTRGGYRGRGARGRGYRGRGRGDSGYRGRGRGNRGRGRGRGRGYRGGRGRRSYDYNNQYQNNFAGYQAPDGNYNETTNPTPNGRNENNGNNQSQTPKSGKKNGNDRVTTNAESSQTQRDVSTIQYNNLLDANRNSTRRITLNMHPSTKKIGDNSDRRALSNQL